MDSKALGSSGPTLSTVYDDDSEEERIKQVWEKTRKHRGGLGMEAGVDMTVKNKHSNRLVKKWTTEEAAALMSLGTGGILVPRHIP